MHAPAPVLIATITAAALVTSGPLAAQPQAAPTPAAAPDEGWHFSAVAMAAISVADDIEATAPAIGARLAAGRWLHRNLEMRATHSSMPGAIELDSVTTVGLGIGVYWR